MNLATEKPHTQNIGCGAFVVLGLNCADSGGQLPKRPRPHILEDISLNRLHEAFVHEGWTVENLTKDYGEDLLVRIFERGVTTPFSFFVQAKATDDVDKLRSKKTARISYRVESGYVLHWV